jgi:hypothetical protein
MHDHLSPGIARRDVLRVLALGASAVTSAACVPLAATNAEADSHLDKPRYRVTENVEAFYRVNRY